MFLQKNKPSTDLAVGNSIVSENIQRSLFGKFSQNYKQYLKIPEKKDTIDLYKDMFIQSKILTTDADRMLLYFNLPMEIIRAEMKPYKFFQRDINNQTNKSSSPVLNELLDLFKEDK